MKDDGGPAFPQSVAIGGPGDAPTASYDMVDGDGMSLRDWFAGQALGPMIDNIRRHPPAELGSLFMDAILQKKPEEIPEEKLREQAEMLAKQIREIAHASYFVADAMLAERAKERDDE